MSAQLCIKLFTELTDVSEDVKFFESDRWTDETEKQLLLKLQELLSVTRHCGKSFEVKINMNVKNFDEALFLVRKKINHRPEINHQKLSIREIEVLDLIMQGYTNNEIAEKLFICYETVKSHRKNILLKTGTKNTAALVTHYHQTFFEK